MTYVIGPPCIDIKDASCVAECPVDCIYVGGRMLYIQPDECIDCGACEPVCPVEAIYPEEFPARRLPALHRGERRLLRDDWPRRAGGCSRNGAQRGGSSRRCRLARIAVRLRNPEFATVGDVNESHGCPLVRLRSSFPRIRRRPVEHLRRPTRGAGGLLGDVRRLLRAVPLRGRAGGGPRRRDVLLRPRGGAARHRCGAPDPAQRRSPRPAAVPVGAIPVLHAACRRSHGVRHSAFQPPRRSMPSSQRGAAI